MSEELNLDDFADLLAPAGASDGAGSLVRTFRPNRDDPAEIGLYPPTFPIELALQTATVPEILAAYGIDGGDQWDRLQRHPIFLRDLAAAVEAVKKHGMSFKLKAGLQAEAMLERIWEMTHAPYDEVPPAVQAQLMQFTIKAAGLDASKDQAGNAAGTPLQININLT